MPKLGTIMLTGLSGATYEFSVYPRHDAFKPLGGVYFYAKRIPIAGHGAEYTWIYVGETADLSNRPLDGRRKGCIDQHDANCVCLNIEPKADVRIDIVNDLRAVYEPPCNRG